MNRQAKDAPIEHKLGAVVWKAMTEFYGTRWTESHGPLPSEYWLAELGKHHPLVVKTALELQARQSREHPPSLGQFCEQLKIAERRVRQPAGPPDFLKKIANVRRARPEHVAACLESMRGNLGRRSAETDPSPQVDRLVESGCTCKSTGTCETCRAWIERTGAARV